MGLFTRTIKTSLDDDIKTVRALYTELASLQAAISKFDARLTSVEQKQTSLHNKINRSGVPSASEDLEPTSLYDKVLVKEK